MNTIKRPVTLAEVRDGLCQMYADVMNDPRCAPQVHEGSNALGKTIRACKILIEYCEVTKEKPPEEWKRFITAIQ